MLLSEKPDMLFSADFLMKSVRRYAAGRPVQFSAVVNGDETTSTGWIERPFKLKPGKIDHPAFKEVEVWRSPYHWEMPVPSRWFIPPRSDTCVFIDADMIACRDLGPLYSLNRESVHGVPAYNTVMPIEKWNLLKFNYDDLKYYFNFGLVVVPAQYMTLIGHRLLRIMPFVLERFPEYHYFAGQIALACALRQMGLNRCPLPGSFNWYDILPPPEDLDSILFLHYMSNRDSIYCPKTACQGGSSPYKKLISRVARTIYTPM
jgi:hypothetical protein